MFPPSIQRQFSVALATIQYALDSMHLTELIHRKAHQQRRQFRDCRSTLQRIKEEQEKLRTREWSYPKTCPVCLEEFAKDPNQPSAPPETVLESSMPDTDEEDPSAPLLPSHGGSKQSGTGAGMVTEEPNASVMAGSGKKVRRRNSERLDTSADTPSPTRQRKVTNSTEKTTADGVTQNRNPMTLPCGHTFCEPCLQRWLDKAVTCPICRERVDRPPAHQQDDPSRPSSSAAGPSTLPQDGDGCRAREGILAGQQRHRLMTDDWLNAELAFRLLTLQQRYPHYVTPSMVDSWSTEARDTGTFNWEATREFMLNDPVVRAQHEASGRSGNAVSFGGGSGSQGGGAGGGW